MIDINTNNLAISLSITIFRAYPNCFYMLPISYNSAQIIKLEKLKSRAYARVLRLHYTKGSVHEVKRLLAIAKRIKLEIDNNTQVSLF